MRRMSEAKTSKLVRLFREGVPILLISHQLGITPSTTAMKITALRKEGHNLPRRTRPTTNRGMTYRQRPDKRPVPQADWAMRPCLGPLCMGKRFNSPGPFSRLCPACKQSNKLICDRIEA
jgi:hypothetical protein